jgi:hypothetical protein
MKTHIEYCCRSKPTGEQRLATRRARRLRGRWQALLPRRRAAIPAQAAAYEDAGRATWLIPDQEGANVLATICLHTQTRGNISPSRGRLRGTTLASALKSRSSPGVRLYLFASGYWWIKQITGKLLQLNLTNLIHDGKSFTARSEHPTRDWA